MLLYRYVNPLTMWLTLATFVGYAVVYTVLLKPATPQNIVIGGASGAMPPVLGWAAVTGDVGAGGAAPVPDHLRLDAAALLVARALPRAGLREGRAADAAGDARPRATRSCRSCSTRCALVAVTLLPYAIRMSGVLYLVAALALGGVFLRLRGAALPRLQRRARARDVQVLDLLSRGAVLGAAGRPLLALMRHAGESRGRSWSPLTLALAGCGPDGPQFKASDVTGTAFGRDFALTDHTGKPRTLADFRGKAVVLFFGYTQCPDVCPTTLADAGRSDAAARARTRTACRCCS